MLHDRAALILIFGVPLFAFVVLTAVFSNPVIRGLGVVVVYADRSDASRALVEQVAASPGLSIVERAANLASAARAIVGAERQPRGRRQTRRSPRGAESIAHRVAGRGDDRAGQLRCYMAVLLGQAARSLPLSDSAPAFAALPARAVLYTLLASLRLRSLAKSAAPAAAAPQLSAAVAPRGFGGAFVAEWRRVLPLRGVFILLVPLPLC